MENIVSTISAITIALSAIVSPAPSALPNSQQVQKEPYVIYVVQKGDSLGTIAGEKLGNTDHWTTIWNHNPEIENPDLIEEGDRIKILNEKKALPEELKKELLEKNNKSLSVKTPSKRTEATSSAQAPSPTQAAVAPASSPTSLNEAQIQFLGNCESGMTAARNSGNGYYGAFQFSIPTWNSMGTGYERADLAPLEVQRDAVQRLLQRSSIFTQFPGCAAQMRAQGLI